MKLTEQQSKTVEDNHKLIYWYIHMKHLDLEEWYGLLAIELCTAVIKHDPERGSLATYFKLRADGLTYKEYRKTKSAKRSGVTVQYMDEIIKYDVTNTIEDEYLLEELMDTHNGRILELKAQGYNQIEIGELVGVSQSYVSKVIKKLKEVYYAN